MEDTQLYDTMVHLAGEIKLGREEEQRINRDLNTKQILQKNREAQLMAEICAETEEVEVQPKRKDDLPTKKTISKFSNKEQRDAELLRRSSADEIMQGWASEILTLLEQKSQKQIDVEHKEMLYRAALSQNQREARTISVLSRKAVVLHEGGE